MSETGEYTSPTGKETNNVNPAEIAARAKRSQEELLLEEQEKAAQEKATRERKAEEQKKLATARAELQALLASIVSPKPITLEEAFQRAMARELNTRDETSPTERNYRYASELPPPKPAQLLDPDEAELALSKNEFVPGSTGYSALELEGMREQRQPFTINDEAWQQHASSYAKFYGENPPGVDTPKGRYLYQNYFVNGYKPWKEQAAQAQQELWSHREWPQLKAERVADSEQRFRMAEQNHQATTPIEPAVPLQARGE